MNQFLDKMSVFVLRKAAHADSTLCSHVLCVRRQAPAASLNHPGQLPMQGRHAPRDTAPCLRRFTHRLYSGSAVFPPAVRPHPRPPRTRSCRQTVQVGGGVCLYSYPTNTLSNAFSLDVILPPPAGRPPAEDCGARGGLLPRILSSTLEPAPEGTGSPGTPSPLLHSQWLRPEPVSRCRKRCSSAETWNQQI